MIPKTLHYCWFGKGNKPPLVEKCIASWKKYMPDYEIIEWNEDNFDINMNSYTRMCYEQKKIAFLTDYIRLLVIEAQGGIYLDTDVEAVASFNKLLKYDAFFGFENDDFVNTGEGFGAVAHHPIVQRMIRTYDKLLDGEHGTIGCPILNTEALEEVGLKKTGKMQMIDGAIILPVEYLNPRDSVTGRLEKTKNTVSIHWYAASWLPWHKRVRSKVLRPIHRICSRNKK